MNVKVYTFTVYREQIELIYLLTVVLEKNHFYCVAELSYKLNQAWNVI